MDDEGGTAPDAGMDAVEGDGKDDFGAVVVVGQEQVLILGFEGAARIDDFVAILEAISKRRYP